jgi:xanthosine phosphorylase
VDFIQAKAPGFAPKLGIILGSGCGDVGKAVENPVVIPYSELPDFPVSTVSGHAGKLLLGQLNGVSVACLQGRVHLYEGMDPAKVRVYIYTLRLLGCEVLFLTSAVGSLVLENGPGTLLCVSDHINLQGRHPLMGPNDPLGTRFPSMLDAYDPKLRSLMQTCAKDCDLRLPEGVYLAITGPSFETPAEIRAFKTLGADVVGMSVVPEVICARHCGLRVAAVAICVNLASGLQERHITHEDTLHWTGKAAGDVKKLLTAFIEKHASWDTTDGPEGRGQKRKAEEA